MDKKKPGKPLTLEGKEKKMPESNCLTGKSMRINKTLDYVVNFTITNNTK